MWAAFFGFAGVALGAFAAHALKQALNAYSLGVLRTGLDYQLWHVPVLLWLASAIKLWPHRFWLLAANLFIAGLVLFCGSLYLIAFGAPRWLGAVTPLGGLLMLAAWLTLAWAVLKHREL